jgi:acetyl-CoA C-acetyltransferase
MREAVIVSTARTPIGKAYRGAFNDTQGQALGGHAIAEAVRRAGIDPAEIGDVVMGAALQQGSTGGNIARQAALRAGLPDTVAGMSMDRQCASGLMAIATAAKQIMVDGIDCRGRRRARIHLARPERAPEPPPRRRSLARGACAAGLHDHAGDGRDRGRALRRVPRRARRIRAPIAAPHRRGAGCGPLQGRDRPDHDDDGGADKATGEILRREITLDKDEGNRPQTRLEDLQKLQPVFKNGQRIKEGRYITAGNASQLSDGASACVLMEAKEAERRGLQPLGAYRGMAVAGCNPTRWGSGRSSPCRSS